MAAGIILKGARIATGNERTPHADAVSIKDGRFARVGDERDVMSDAEPQTQVIDLGVVRSSRV